MEESSYTWKMASAGRLMDKAEVWCAGLLAPTHVTRYHCPELRVSWHGIAPVSASGDQRFYL